MRARISAGSLVSWRRRSTFRMDSGVNSAGCAWYEAAICGLCPAVQVAQICSFCALSSASASADSFCTSWRSAASSSAGEGPGGTGGAAGRGQAARSNVNSSGGAKPALRKTTRISSR